MSSGTAMACTWHRPCAPHNHVQCLQEDRTSGSSTAYSVLVPLQVPREYSLFSQLMDARNKETQQPLSDLEICAQTFTLLLAGEKGREGTVLCLIPACICFCISAKCRLLVLLMVLKEGTFWPVLYIVNANCNSAGLLLCWQLA